MDIKGKVAFVTGAAMRVGRVIALALAEQGAHVAFTYLSDQEPWHKTLVEIESYSVDAGDSVREGHTLVKIDPKDYHLALKEAEANLEVSRAMLEASEKSF